MLKCRCCLGKGTIHMFADLELARRLERTEGAAGAAFVAARREGTEWADHHGVFLMFDGLDSPLTQTFGLGMREPATDEVLDEIEGFFGRHGAPVNHEVCPLAGVAVLTSLAKRGYVPCEVSNVLFLDLETPRAQVELNPALSVRVAGTEELNTYAHVLAQGWKEALEFALQIEEMARAMATAPGYVGFLVAKGEALIAGAGLFVHDGVALLAGASTIKEDRGQGAQRAVLTARLDYARKEGCQLAMVVTEPGSASQRNAERNGFRIAYTRTKWRRAAKG